MFDTHFIFNVHNNFVKLKHPCGKNLVDSNWKSYR